jgi:HAD superfamily hydrolase (TIGR01549 family)
VADGRAPNGSQARAVSWDPSAAGVLLDLDETLVLSSAIAHLRQQRRWNDVYNALGATSTPPGTVDFLAQAAQLGHIGVITMAPRRYAELVLAHHGLRLPVLVAYHDVRKRKPDPESILLAAQKHGVDARLCVYIGDAATDLVAAHAAGAVPIGISWDGTLLSDPQRRLAFALCRNWDEVLDAVVAALAARFSVRP